MTVEFSEELNSALDSQHNLLHIQRTTIPESQLQERHLSRPFGNAYHFDQDEPLAAASLMES